MRRPLVVCCLLLACGGPPEPPSPAPRISPATPPAPEPPAKVEPPSDPGPLGMGEKLYSQLNEELIIRHFFRDRREGFFLDVGAGHHRRYSTTLYLEKHLGWRGIAVDALSEYADGYREHRPGTTFVNRLVGDRDGGSGAFYRAEKLPEVSSVRRAVAQEQAKLYKGDDRVEKIEVRMSTLDTILSEQGVESIDFLSMDIEEHEPAALAGFDIDRFRPELVCIESHESVRESILRYFTDHGYERIDAYLEHDDYNWYFKPRAAPGNDQAGD